MATTTTDDPFRSARLLYRAVDKSTDLPFFTSIYQTPLDYQQSNFRISKPQGTQQAEKHMKYMADEALIGVVICLPPPPAKAAEEKPIPIGLIHLEPLGQGFTHHRHADIGVDIAKAHQGKGYGSEAIRWVLDWGFETAGLHRVGIRAFEYNEGGVRLYQRLGFKLEGRSRDFVWARGRWWDDLGFGMLEGEWRELRAKGMVIDQAS